MNRSHAGPCMVYMAPLSSQGDGDVWFKIFEEGYDVDEKKYCTIQVIDNHGRMDVTIPKEIPSGDYIVRAELVALYPTKVVGTTQFYPNCVVVSVTNGAASSLPMGYAIPGIYGYKDEGVLYGRRDDPAKYVVPGPPIFAPNTTQVNNKQQQQQQQQQQQ
ncbi:hypothetical protein IW138_005218 [Coemansia sp. RSA 986]|nr:hypothetical protein IW138_005218 [Coemansia sp. RSA 986]